MPDVFTWLPIYVGLALQVLLASISAQPDAAVDSLSIVSQAAAQELLQFDLTPELVALLPAPHAQYDDTCWPVLLDNHRQLLPFGVPGEKTSADKVSRARC